jgi:hypothetical protein
MEHILNIRVTHGNIFAKVFWREEPFFAIEIYKFVEEKHATINWSGCGTRDIQFAKDYLSLLERAVEIAKVIDSIGNLIVTSVNENRITAEEAIRLHGFSYAFPRLLSDVEEEIKQGSA